MNTVLKRFFLLFTAFSLVSVAMHVTAGSPIINLLDKADKVGEVATEKVKDLAVVAKYRISDALYDFKTFTGDTVSALWDHKKKLIFISSVIGGVSGYACFDPKTSAVGKTIFKALFYNGPLITAKIIAAISIGVPAIKVGWKAGTVWMAQPFGTKSSRAFNNTVSAVKRAGRVGYAWTVQPVAGLVTSYFGSEDADTPTEQAVCPIEQKPAPAKELRLTDSEQREISSINAKTAELQAQTVALKKKREEEARRVQIEKEQAEKERVAQELAAQNEAAAQRVRVNGNRNRSVQRGHRTAVARRR